ncbi:hypothetical protein CRUP_030733 [Coryphaenoides rupestris]|nr:hypothetical protein CRUP_030733 [Coryphaenoides rupestris]
MHLAEVAALLNNNDNNSSCDGPLSLCYAERPAPLRMHCQTCSLVTSSGHLLGGRRGPEIDGAECVIRMNDAPVSRGYAADVGRRTSLRVIAHSSMQRVLRSRQELLNASQDTAFVFWGPSSYMRRDGRGLVYNNLRLMSQALPKLHVYIVSLQKMLQFDELFKRETGKDRGAQRSGGGGGGGGDDAVTDQRAPSCIPETEILQHFLSTWGFQFSTPKRIATAS